MNRKTQSNLALFCVGVFVCLAATSTEAGAATRLKLDRSFGSNGWASFSSPGKHASISAVECAADGGRFFASFHTENRAVQVTGGVIKSFNSRGRTARAFGRDGFIKFPKNRLPFSFEISPDGSLIVMTATIGSKNRYVAWNLERYTRRGKRDNGFGTGGSIKFLPADKKNPPYPAFEVLGDGRIAIRSSTAPGELQILTPRGKPDTQFGFGGSVTPRHGNSITHLGSDGKLLVASGSKLGQLTANGETDPTFSGGTTVDVGSPPANVIAAAGREIPTTAEFTNTISSLTTLSDGTISMTVESRRMDINDFESIDWALRLAPNGSRSVPWQFGGSRYLGSSFWYDEAGWGGTYASSSIALPNGKTLVESSEWPEEADDSPEERKLTVRSFASNGSFAPASAKIFSVTNFMSESLAIDRSGRTAFVCGTLGNYYVATKLKI